MEIFQNREIDCFSGYVRSGVSNGTHIGGIGVGDGKMPGCVYGGHDGNGIGRGFIYGDRKYHHGIGDGYSSYGNTDGDGSGDGFYVQDDFTAEYVMLAELAFRKSIFIGGAIWNY